MATENDGIRAFEAAAALAAGRGVIIDANGKINYPTAVGHSLLGILLNDVAAGEHGSVKLMSSGGVFKVKLGNDAVTMAAQGVPLYLAAANGLFVDTDPGGGTVWFRAIQSCDASGMCEAVPVRLA